MNQDSERSKVFQPKGNLAWQAVLCETRALPLKFWLGLSAYFSGLLIAANLANQFYFHSAVPPWKWVLSALAGPIPLFAIPFVIYLMYRFARPLSLSSSGLRVGKRPLGRFWRPVDCRIVDYRQTVPLFCLSIYGKAPWDSKARVTYSAVTDDHISAQEFVDAFHQRFPAIEKK